MRRTKAGTGSRYLWPSRDWLGDVPTSECERAGWASREDREMRRQRKVEERWWGEGGGRREGREAEEGKSLAVESFYKPLSNSRERRTLAASGRG